jgi:hypothetical protein
LVMMSLVLLSVIGPHGVYLSQEGEPKVETGKAPENDPPPGNPRS